MVRLNNQLNITSTCVKMKRIGNHVTKDGKKMDAAINDLIITAEANEIHSDCAQIFLIGPQSTRENLSEDEKSGIKKIISRGVRIYAHASYLSNPWGAKAAFGASLVRKELKLCDEIGIRGLVVHIARKSPVEIASVIPSLLTDSKNAILFLEIESYKPLTEDKSAMTSCTYETPYKLNELLKSIDPSVMHRVGICIDTAHLWAAGTDISTHSNMRKWFEELKALNCTNYLIHLNDQIWTLGGGRDEHAPLLRGTIWGRFNPELDPIDTPENSGLKAVLEWSAEHNVDMILERKSAKPVIKDASGNIINNILSDYHMLLIAFGNWLR